MSSKQINSGNRVPGQRRHIGRAAGLPQVRDGPQRSADIVGGRQHTGRAAGCRIQHNLVARRFSAHKAAQRRLGLSKNFRVDRIAVVHHKQVTDRLVCKRDVAGGDALSPD